MIEKRTLKNGVRIVYEPIPYVRSASIGVWVGCGSRYEKDSESGASHFIEHMVFKGTETRTAAELAALSDRLGGHLNAFTTKECTCFYGRVLDTHIPLFLDVLCDMLFCSKFDASDIENERGVILEEIGMYKDVPDDLVFERLLSSVYKGPLGRPILGRKSTLSKMDGAFLRDYMARRYTPDRIVVAVSGSFTQKDIDDIAQRFENVSGDPYSCRRAAYTPAFTVKRKNVEQNHICLAFPGLPIGHPDIYAMLLLSNILGGGSSSRLFQNVRESRGLCYNIYTFTSSFEDTGIMGVYTAVNKAVEKKALTVIIDEIRSFCHNVTDQELFLAKEQAKSNILMSLESTGSRMNRMGRSELTLGYIPSTDDMIASYDKVTKEDILSMCGRIFVPEKMSFSALGRSLPPEEYAKILGL